MESPAKMPTRTRVGEKTFLNQEVTLSSVPSL